MTPLPEAPGEEWGSPSSHMELELEQTVQADTERDWRFHLTPGSLTCLCLGLRSPSSPHQQGGQFHKHARRGLCGEPGEEGSLGLIHEAGAAALSPETPKPGV